MRSFNLIKTATKKKDDHKKQIANAVSAAGGVADGVLMQEIIPSLVNTIKHGRSIETISLPAQLALLTGGVSSPLISKQLGGKESDHSKYFGLGLIGGAVGKNIHMQNLLDGQENAVKKLMGNKKLREQMSRIAGINDINVKDIEKGTDIQKNLQHKTTLGLGIYGGAMAYIGHKGSENSKKGKNK